MSVPLWRIWGIRKLRKCGLLVDVMGWILEYLAGIAGCLSGRRCSDGIWCAGYLLGINTWGREEAWGEIGLLGQREKLIRDKGTAKLWPTLGGALEHILPIRVIAQVGMKLLSLSTQSVTEYWLPFQGVSLGKVTFCSWGKPWGADSWDNMLPLEGDQGDAPPWLPQLVGDRVKTELGFYWLRSWWYSFTLSFN